jgi:hypothetical protein
VLSDDSSDDEEEAEDPLDWWVDEELPNVGNSDEGAQVDEDDTKLKGKGPDDASV